MPQAMKTVVSMGDLQRLAARTGASAEVGGRIVNAGGEKLAVTVRPPAAPAVAALPPPPDVKPGLSAEEVRALLDERDAAWERRMDAIFSALMLSGDKRQTTAPTWDFIVEYGSKKEITGIRAIPTQ